MFHAMRAILVFNSFDTRKHSGVIAEFRRIYIKENLLPIGLSKMIGSAFTIRNASDYDDMFIASKSDTQAQIENAEAVYTSIREYIQQNMLSPQGG